MLRLDVHPLTFALKLVGNYSIIIYKDLHLPSFILKQDSSIVKVRNYAFNISVVLNAVVVRKLSTQWCDRIVFHIKRQ